MKVPVYPTLVLLLFSPFFTTGQPPADFCSSTSSPEALPNNCFDACITCDLNGFTGLVNNDFGQLPTDFCNVGANFSDNAGWVSFIAASPTLFMSVTDAGCSPGELEIQLFRTNDCNTFTPVSDCTTVSSSMLSAPINLTGPLVPGERYFLVANAPAGNACTFTIDVIEGSTQVPMPSPPAISAPASICSGAPLNFFLTSPIENIDNFLWTLNGAVISTNSSGLIPAPADLPDGAQAELCVAVSNGCSPAPLSECTTITINQNYETDLEASICQGESYNIGGITFDQSGNYQITLTASNGCDSTINLNLSVFPAVFTNLAATICDGETYTVGNTVYTQPDSYTEVLTTTNGCDSIVNLTLSVTSSVTALISDTLCADPDVYCFYFPPEIPCPLVPGFYSWNDTIPGGTQSGCDSILNFEITVVPYIDIYLDSIFLQPGESFELSGNSYTQSGWYEVESGPAGCDTAYTFAIVYDPPANDQGSQAAELALSPLPDCPDVGEVRDTFTYHTFGATGTTPYLDLMCSSADHLTGPAPDIWFKFTATGNTLTVRFLDAVQNPPDVVLFRGEDWATSLPVFCASGIPLINAPIFELQVIPGETYYLLVAGNEPEAERFFTFEVVSERSCDPCLREGKITLDPPPYFGRYGLDTPVEICYELTGWNAGPTGDTWLHSVVFEQALMGDIWELNNFIPGIVPSCDIQGTWNYYPDWFSQSTSSPFSFGFAYDSNLGGPNGDGNPGNNLGDGFNNCAESVPRQFCWTTAVGNPMGCTPGATSDASLAITPYSDAESGGSSDFSCASPDLNGTARVILSAICCDDPPPMITGSQNPSCGACNGAIAFQGGGDGPWRYRLLDQTGNVLGEERLSTGALTVSGLCAGQYRMEATNVITGCRRTSFTSLFPADTLSPVITGSPFFCPGGATTLTVGNLPAANDITYSWNTGATTPTITINTPGLYQVTVTADGCEGSAELTVSTLPAPTVFINTQPSTGCEDDPVQLCATGGNLVSYSWSSGQTTSCIEVTNSGTYSVTVTDANGCSATAGTILDLAPAPVAEITLNPPIVCQGEIVSATATPGFITYDWNSGQTGSMVQLAPTAPLTISVTVTDANGCVAEDSVFIDPQPVPQAPAIICSDITSESITFTWSEDDPNATYTVTGPPGVQNGSSFTVTGLAPGETVTIEVAAVTPAGCFSNSTHSCTTFLCDDLTVAIDPAGPVCEDAAPFLLTAMVTGGAGNGSGAWSGPGIIDTATGLFDPSAAGAGQHSVNYVYTEGNCTVEDNLLLNVQPLLVPPVISCMATTNEIVFSWDPVDHTIGYQVDVPTGQSGTLNGTQFVITALLPDEEVTIAVTAVSGNACPDVTSSLTCATLSCSYLTIDAEPVPPLCEDEGPVTLQATVTGTGTGIWSWDGPGLIAGTDTSTPVFDPAVAGAGTTALTATYTEGTCSVSLSLNITVSEAVALEIDLPPACITTLTPCFELNAIVNGGNGNAQISWSGPGISQPASGLAVFCADQAGAGVHLLTATYSDGACEASDQITLEVVSPPDAGFSIADQSVCLNVSTFIVYTGSADPNETVFNWNFDGGTVLSGSGPGPYTVSWPDPGARQVSLTIEENGCLSETFSQEIVVEATLPAPILVCSATPTSMLFEWEEVPGANGYEVALLSGPAGVLVGNSYLIDGLQPGETVEISVTANGPCGGNMATISCQTLSCPDVILIIDPVADLCLDENTSPFLLTTQIIGGDSPGVLAWEGPGIADPATGLFDPELAGPGQHFVTVTYTNGICSYMTDITISISTPVQLSDIHAECDGAGNYIVTMEVQTQLSAFTFVSDPIPGGASELFTFPLSPGCPPATFSITKSCDCITAIDDFTTGSLQMLCADEYLLLSDNFSTTLEPDDALQYIIHDNSGNVPGQVYAVLDEPVLAHTAGIPLETVLYFSPVAGNDLGNGDVDLNDPCLAVAPGQPVLFLPLPDLETGEDPVICQGETAELTVQSNDALAYLWTPATFLSCTDCINPIASPDTTTTYQVTAVNAEGCTSTGEMTVYVDEFPGYLIPEIDPVCPGQDYEFCLPDAQSYSWSGPGGYFSTDQCLIWTEVTEEFAGDYTVDIQLSDQCFITETVTLDLAPPVVVNGFPADTMVCPLTLVPLSTDIEGAAGYLWFPQQAVFCDTCASTFAMVYKKTTITLLIFDENGCTSQESFTIFMDGDCGGIGGIFGFPFPPGPQPVPGSGDEAVEQPQLTVYPNPTSDVLHIAIRDAVPGRLQLFDLHGRLVADRRHFENASYLSQASLDRKQPGVASYLSPVSLNVKGLPAGTYLLRVVTDRGVLSGKVIVR